MPEGRLEARSTRSPARNSHAPRAATPLRSLLRFGLVPAVLCCCAAPAPAAELFRDVIAVNRFFERGKTAPSLRLRTLEPAVIDVVIYNWDGVPVAHSSSRGEARKHEIKLDALPVVGRGIYFFCLTASDRNGKRVGSYPATPGGGKCVKVSEAKADEKKQCIEYFLQKSSYVRIRAGIDGGPYLAPLRTWRVQSAGKRSVPWDGSCQEGAFRNLYSHPKLKISISSVTTPVNILVADNLQGTDGSAAKAERLTLPEHLSDLAKPPWPLAELRKSKAEPMPVVDDRP